MALRRAQKVSWAFEKRAPGIYVLHEIAPNFDQPISKEIFKLLNDLEFITESCGAILLLEYFQFSTQSSSITFHSRNGTKIRIGPSLVIWL